MAMRTHGPLGLGAVRNVWSMGSGRVRPLKRTLLLDGDIFIYQIASRMEQAFDWGDGQWSLYADQHEAEGRLRDYIEGLSQSLEADAVIIAIKDKENWRRSVLPTYKANREGVREPMLRQPLMAFLSENYKVYSRPTLEGDDVLGILSTGRIVLGEKVVVSIDKDMKTIPGFHYNPNHSDDGIVTVDPVAADLAHLKQTLMGDATDGYSGCPGIGPKRAEIILNAALDDYLREFPEPQSIAHACWPAVVATYAKAGLGPDVALTMARVARICRASDYDFKKKEVILWQPPNTA